jgi:hypothetical protein
VCACRQFTAAMLVQPRVQLVALVAGQLPVVGDALEDLQKFQTSGGFQVCFGEGRTRTARNAAVSPSTVYKRMLQTTVQDKARHHKRALC